MRAFPGVSKIAGVQVGEIRVRDIGRSPATMGKFALMTLSGQSCGLFILHQFSDRTQHLLRALIESMEDDAASQLSEYDGPPAGSGPWGEGDEGSGDDENGMDFG